MTKATETSRESQHLLPPIRSPLISSPSSLLLQVYIDRNAHDNTRVATLGLRPPSRMTRVLLGYPLRNYGFYLFQISRSHLSLSAIMFCGFFSVENMIIRCIHLLDTQVLKSFSYWHPRSRYLYLFRRENNLELYIFILLYRKKKFQEKKKGFINTLPILVNIAHRGNPLRDRLVPLLLLSMPSI